MGDDRDQDFCPDAGEPLDELLIFGNPETRRVFLKRVAGTSAALAIGPGLFAASSVQAESATPSPAAASSAGTVNVHFKINGQEQVLDLDPRVSLLDALREHLNLTGSKKG